MSTDHGGMVTRVVRPGTALAWREIVRFLRQRSRIVGALGTPLVFWLLIGSGLGRSFRTVDNGVNNYLEYFFPGTIVLIVMFTAIFCMISIIEDRREGFLQGVLVCPAGRLAIVFGKVVGTAVLALVQAVLFLLLAPLCGVPLSIASLPAALGVLLILSVGLSLLGYVVAWPMQSTQGFHAVMNLFLMPLWLLSGALFPASGAAGWIALIVKLNPLTYGLAALRRVLYDGGAGTSDLPSLAISLAVMFVVIVLMGGLATWMTYRGHGR